MTRSRRKFLTSLLGTPAILAIGGAVPSLFSSALAMGAETVGDKVLVVVQMTGGNDGLNTVIPFADPDYRKLRPTLAVPQSDVLMINRQLGFHPSMKGFAELLEGEKLAIVQGVGYDNPNRSHFESMDIWHTGLQKTATRTEGWLGRCVDRWESPSKEVLAMHVGREKLPLALVAQQSRVPSVESLKQFQLDEGKIDRSAKVRELSESPRTESNHLLGFVASSTVSAISVSERVRQAANDYKPHHAYPESALGEKFRLIAQLIDSGFPSRIYYVELDGFDTHSQQAAAHSGLLRQLTDAVSVFVRDLDAQGNGDRVVTMCFSEFGRRVAENASEGTDHGTAAPMFLAGNSVKPGLIGEHPSLADLDQGDLKHHTDFRQVYASLLNHWLGSHATQVLGKSYDPIPILKTMQQSDGDKT
ncbi:MAG: DUF1501 domain-containing protein [Planctomycetaceae bacterium]